MDANGVRIAIASLAQSTGFFAGQKSPVADLSGSLPKEDQDILSLASLLAVGGGSRQEQNQTHLKNIFSSLSLSGSASSAGQPGYLPRRKLTLDRESLFPAATLEPAMGDTSLRDAFENVGMGVSQDFAGLETFQAELHRMAWSLPSFDDPHVSHYDQQRMTAALAFCLQKLGEGRVNTILGALKSGKGNNGDMEPVALLVGGDISGIQDFIYTITAKGAAKSLRGRSFYLQLLTEAILRLVLRRLKLPYTNVIYSGGGHFFLLAPVDRVDQLNDVQTEITQKLWRHHRSSLYLALGHAPVPADGFLKGNFPEHWGRMHAEMSRRKQKRYSELGEAYYQMVFAVPEFGGNPQETCSVCGEDHRKSRKWDELDIQERICTLCDSFIKEIGTPLPQSKFLVLGFGEPVTAPVARASDVFSELGMQIQFIEDHQGKAEVQAEQVVLWALDDPDEDKWPDANQAAPKWLRYTANHVPEEQFDELQEKVQGGFERLGVLRMDVDNLGDLFKSGFGGNATLTRLASLSFRTSLFFDGWLKALCEQGKYKGLIYTVYSGGDDVFLLGPWDLIPDLAQEIVHDFSEYVGGNPDVHLSACLAFSRGK